LLFSGSLLGIYRGQGSFAGATATHIYIPGYTHTNQTSTTNKQRKEARHTTNSTLPMDTDKLTFSSMYTMYTANFNPVKSKGNGRKRIIWIGTQPVLISHQKMWSPGKQRFVTEPVVGRTSCLRMFKGLIEEEIDEHAPPERIRELVSRYHKFKKEMQLPPTRVDVTPQRGSRSQRKRRRRKVRDEMKTIEEVDVMGSHLSLLKLDARLKAEQIDTTEAPMLPLTTEARKTKTR
jgi:hypothetical protein